MDTDKFLKVKNSLCIFGDAINKNVPVEIIIQDNELLETIDVLRFNTHVAIKDNSIKKLYEDFFSSDSAVNFYLTFISFFIENQSKMFTENNVEYSKISIFFRYNCIIWNLSDFSIELCTKLTSTKSYLFLFKFLKLDSIFNAKNTDCPIRIKIVHSCLGILHNILQNTNTLVRSNYRNCDAVNILCKYANENTENSKFIATAAFMQLAFILNDKEYEQFNSIVDEKIKELLIYLNDSLFEENRYSNSYGYHCEEVLITLKHLAGSERNKKIMLENNILSSIKSGLLKALELQNNKKSDLEATHNLAELNLKLLWSLSFAQKSLEIVKPFKEFYAILNQFNDSIWPYTCRQTSQGILWNINPQDKENLIGLEKTTKTGHIMISYNHKTQELMLKVKKSLEENGYKVWMDVDYKKDSFVDAMAEGIRGAACVLLGLCQAFKNSPHCRQEVKYAYNLNIPLIPLHLEQEFYYEGWLDLVLATIVYIPLYDETKFDQTMETLFQRLDHHGLRQKSYELSSQPSTVPSSFPYEKNKQDQNDHPVLSWTHNEMMKWLEANNLKDLSDRFLQLNSFHLYEMARMNRYALDSLCNYLRIDFRLSFVQTLNLLRALSNLF